MNAIVRRRLLPALVPLAAACATGLAPGRSVTGRLTPADPQFRDGSHYRRYDFTAHAGDVLTFSLTSDDFDAYLILTDRFGNPVSHDDDGGGDCNASLTYLVRSNGAHRLLAGSSARGELGDYRLSVSRGSARASDDSSCYGFGRVAGVIGPGETVAAELTADDPLLDDDTHYQRWILQPGRGHTVTVDLQSEAFDAFLMVTRGRGDKLVQNDDGGTGCNARLVYTATDDHPVRIVVNTVKPRVTGRYVLRVTAGALPIDPKGNCPGDGSG